MTKKRVWLNVITGEFSNSWNASECPLTPDDIEYSYTSGYKLIEYECLNDGDFELCNLMRLR